MTHISLNFCLSLAVTDGLTSLRAASKCCWVMHTIAFSPTPCVHTEYSTYSAECTQNPPNIHDHFAAELLLQFSPSKFDAMLSPAV